MAHTDISPREKLSTYAQNLLQSAGKFSVLWRTLRASIWGRNSELSGQGIWRGVALWFEAVVAPYYAGWVSALVYAGAALLLLLIGLHRFTESIGTGAVIAALVLEVCLLLLLAATLGAAPSAQSTVVDSVATELKDIANEIAEIASDAWKIQEGHRELLRAWQDVGEQQRKLLEQFRTALDTLARLPLPGEKFIGALEQVRQSLDATAGMLQHLSTELQQWRQEQLQELIRQELVRLLGDRLTRTPPSEH